jgi:hypothetical protein
MYSAYQLSESSRNILLDRFPPKYLKVITHHITVRYPATSKEDLPKPSDNILVVGHIDSGDGLEAFLVTVDGEDTRPDGKIYHITHSLDSEFGYKPVDSNNLIKEKDKIKHFPPIKIEAKPVIL